MIPNKSFKIQRVYPSEKGLHLEFLTLEEAKYFYQTAPGNRYKLDGQTVILTTKLNETK